MTRLRLTLHCVSMDRYGVPAMELLTLERFSLPNNDHGGLFPRLRCIAIDSEGEGNSMASTGILLASLFKVTEQSPLNEFQITDIRAHPILRTKLEEYLTAGKISTLQISSHISSRFLRCCSQWTSLQSLDVAMINQLSFNEARQISFLPSLVSMYFDASEVSEASIIDYSSWPTSMDSSRISFQKINSLILFLPSISTVYEFLEVSSFPVARELRLFYFEAPRLSREPTDIIRSLVKSLNPSIVRIVEVTFLGSSGGGANSAGTDTHAHLSDEALLPLLRLLSLETLRISPGICCNRLSDDILSHCADVWSQIRSILIDTQPRYSCIPLPTTENLRYFLVKCPSIKSLQFPMRLCAPSSNLPRTLNKSLTRMGSIFQHHARLSDTKQFFQGILSTIPNLRNIAFVRLEDDELLVYMNDNYPSVVVDSFTADRCVADNRLVCL